LHVRKSLVIKTTRVWQSKLFPHIFKLEKSNKRNIKKIKRIGTNIFKKNLLAELEEGKACLCRAAVVKGCFEAGQTHYWPTAAEFPSCPSRVACTTAATLGLQLAKGPAVSAKQKRIREPLKLP
jgi:hypothetical protein